MNAPANFNLCLRVPGWAAGVTISLNGTALPVKATPGAWLEIPRAWQPGDVLAYRIPLPTRAVPIDAQHSRRVAYARGPVVLVKPLDGPEAQPASADPAVDKIPFHVAKENGRYTMYFDLPA